MMTELEIDHFDNANPFILRFPGDPVCIRSPADIEEVERISHEKRFPCKTPLEAIATIVDLHKDEIALTFLPNGSAEDIPQRWTYSEYWEDIIAAANLFHELGLGYGESVVFLLPNVPEMLFGLWGAEAAGIAAPINTFLQPEQIARIAKEADARLLVTLGPDQSDELWQKALAVQQQAPFIKHIITIGGATEGTINWAEAMARQPRDAFQFDRPLACKETAAYFHTGGTTGTPKLARHIHQSQVINVCQMMMLGMQEEDFTSGRFVILCGLPLFHVNAVMTSLVAIMNGGELVLAGINGFREKGLIRDFWSLVERYRVTAFAGVPTVYAALLDQPSNDFDLSSLRFGNCGAAPMPPSLQQTFRERTGADVIEGYGMTETTTCATIHAYRGDRKTGSIGMRLPYQKIRIVLLNDNGGVERDCDTDEIGVLLLSGPNVIPEYKQAEANQNAWPEPGWLNSGDMGRRDAEGYYWLTGRAKDLIIRGGHNIDPLITEDALTSHPDVELAAAVGKPDAYAGEVPVAYVQLRAGAQVTVEELKAFAREHAAERAAAPVEVIIREDIPKTAVGKTFKPTLRKDAIARAYQEAAASAWPSGCFMAQVVDDNVHGMSVVIEGIKNDGSSQETIDEAEQAIALHCDQLAYTWELRWHKQIDG